MASTTIAVSSTSAYYTDTDTTGNDTFTADWHIKKARVVINELYYLGNKEWIELYNTGNATANIVGWSICNGNNTCGNLNPAKKTELLPGAFMLVSHDTADLKDWQIAKDIVSINYAGKKIDFDDTGDAVILRNNESTVVDQMNYGSHTSVFIPSCPLVDNNHSLQRRPTDVDTDTSHDFIDQIEPSPGK